MSVHLVSPETRVACIKLLGEICANEAIDDLVSLQLLNWDKKPLIAGKFQEINLEAKEMRDALRHALEHFGLLARDKVVNFAICEEWELMKMAVRTDVKLFTENKRQEICADLLSKMESKEILLELLRKKIEAEKDKAARERMARFIECIRVFGGRS
ncbi:MAG: hypothetical protein AAB215_07780 [Planctomycetota bacterium]